MLDVAALDRTVHPWIAESDRRVRFGLGILGWRAGGDLLRLGQTAEHLGFDSYWVQDHPMGGPSAGRASPRWQLRLSDSGWDRSSAACTTAAQLCWRARQRMSTG